MRRALIAVLAGVALATAGCRDGGDPEVTAPRPGQPEADVTAAVLAGLGDGPEVDLASYRGTPLLVNFFASTCAPCVLEMPTIEAAYQEAGGAFAVVGVATNDNVERALALVEDTGVTWDLAADPRGDFIVRAGGTAMPTTLFVDRDGAIVDIRIGEMDEGELAGLLRDHFDIEV